MTLPELCGIIIAELMSTDWLIASFVIPFLLGCILAVYKRGQGRT